jgi:rRNA processing protein Gar1
MRESEADSVLNPETDTAVAVSDERLIPAFSREVPEDFEELFRRYRRPRVPAAEQAAATAEMGRLGRVTNESQTGEVVSQEHADLVARLKTARETEARFPVILQQRTGKVSDVLGVEQNIARVRGEIEAMEGSRRDSSIGFATLEVALTQEYKAPLESQSDSVGTRFHNALVAGYRNMTGLLLGLALFVVENGPPVLAVLFWRRYGKVRGRDVARRSNFRIGHCFQSDERARSVWMAAFPPNCILSAMRQRG